MKSIHIVLHTIMILSFISCSESDFSGQAAKTKKSNLSTSNATPGILRLDVEPQISQVEVGSTTTYQVFVVNSNGDRTDITKQAQRSIESTEIRAADDDQPAVVALAPGLAKTVFTYEQVSADWQFQVVAPTDTPMAPTDKPVAPSNPDNPAPAAGPETLALEVTTTIFRGESVPVYLRLVSADSVNDITAKAGSSLAISNTDVGTLTINNQDNSASLTAVTLGELVVSGSYGNDANKLTAEPITVTVVNRAPNITSDPPTSYTANTQSYVYQVVASDPDNDPLSYQLRNPVPGLSIDATTGLISYNQQEQHLPTVEVNVIVSDGLGGDFSQSYIIQVKDQNSQVCTTTGQLNIPVLAVPARKDWTLSQHAANAKLANPGLPADIKATPIASIPLTAIEGNRLPIESFSIDDIAVIVRSDMDLSKMYRFDAEKSARVFTIPDDALMLYNADDPRFASGSLDSHMRTIYHFGESASVDLPAGVSKSLAQVYTLGVPLIAHNEVDIAMLSEKGMIIDGNISFKIVNITHGAGHVSASFYVTPCSEP